MRRISNSLDFPDEDALLVFPGGDQQPAVRAEGGRAASFGCFGDQLARLYIPQSSFVFVSARRQKSPVRAEVRDLELIFVAPQRRLQLQRDGRRAAGALRLCDARSVLCRETTAQREQQQTGVKSGSFSQSHNSSSVVN